LNFDFKHLGVYRLGDDLPWLLSSYHPSRQNTQTGRLTGSMFAEVWTTVNEILAGED
jgi:uracil-DNA glycosylase